MYIVNLQKLERYVGGYLEDEKERVKKEYCKLDKPTKYMCGLEISFTEDLLKLVKEYQDRLNKVTDILFEEAKEVKNESSSTDRKIS